MSPIEQENPMKNLKQRFQDDPYFAAFVIVVGASIAAGLIKSTAKMVESSAYAYRASKL